MNTVTVSAPGKLMLFGEHAVVYGNPCIVTAVDQRLTVSIKPRDNHDFLTINAPGVEVINYKKPLKDIGTSDIPRGARFIEVAVKNFHRHILQNKSRVGLDIYTSSDFSASFGFGSSSASTVAVIKALSAMYEVSMSEREIFDLSYQTVLEIQKTGSGFDVASAVYGKTLYFTNFGKTIEKLSLPALPLIVGYSGKKADTVSMISQVSETYSKNKAQTELVFSEIAEIVEQAREALLQNDWKLVGTLMNQNQKYLSELGVSTSMLDIMIANAIQNGAYGSKLSGAGGGDCMIALSSEKKIHSIMKAIEKVGGEIIPVKTNAQGVRIE